MNRISACLALVSLFLFACCVPADYSGTLVGREKSGIGGTGQLADKKTGIGGTGFPAAQDGDVLGILGRITGFGSIVVNGVKVEFDSRTPIFLAGHRTSAGDLAEGQVVEVLALQHGAAVRAESIGIRYEVIGRIESSKQGTPGFLILGQEVLVRNETLMPESWHRTPPPGAKVRVSGFRDPDGRILASRIEQANHSEFDFLIGAVGKGPENRLTVGGLPLINQEQQDSLRIGEIIRVQGKFGPEGLTAWTVDRDGPQLFRRPVNRLLIEGIPAADPGGIFRLGATPFRIQASSVSDPAQPGVPLLFMGVAESGNIPILQRFSPGTRMKSGAEAGTVRKANERNVVKRARSATPGSLGRLGR